MSSPSLPRVGRKRKREALRSAAPAAAAAAADAAAAAVESVDRGRPLEPAAVSYFRSLADELERLQGEEGGRRGGGDDEQQDIALSVSAGWREVQQQSSASAYRLLVNRQSSRCLSLLLSLSDASHRPQLLSLLLSIIPAAFQLMTDRNAARVVQAAITRLQEMQEQQVDDAAALSQALQALCSPLSSPPPAEATAATSSGLSFPPLSCWPLLMLHESASHCMRSLLLALSAGDAALRPALDSVVRSVSSLPAADRVELCFHASASPALQTLMQAVASQPAQASLLHELTAALLLSDSASQSAGQVGSGDCEPELSPAGCRHAQEMSRHRVGSHLLERIIASGSARLLPTPLFRSALRHCLLELALHPYANHCVQAVLVRAAAGAQEDAQHRSVVKQACKRLLPHFRSLLEERRHGVVWRLLQSASCLSVTSQRRLVAALQQALGCDDATQLLGRVLALPSPPPASEARNNAGIGHFPSLLLQALLALPGCDSSSLVSALRSLPTARLLSVACDQRGVHVLEAALTRRGDAQAEAEQQLALLDRLLPLAASLAADRHGSWLVERMWRLAEADASRRQRMREAADRGRLRLQRTKGGRVFLRLTAARSSQ